ncbi:MAG: tetratricopeptide repeat protein [Promethearchaeota archaeon]
MKEDSSTNPKSDGALLAQLELLVESEKYREALQKIEKLESKIEDIDHRLRVGLLKGQCFMGMGDFRSSLEAAEAAATLGIRLQGNKVNIIDALLQKAEALLRLSQVDKSFEAFEQAEQLEQGLLADDQSIIDAIRANILYFKSIAFYYRDDVHKGIECARESLSIRERLADLPGIVASLMRVGYLHIEVDGGQTLEYVEKALELNKELGKKEHMIAACQFKALVEQGRGNWEEAEQLLTKGINLAREYDFPGWERGHLLVFALMYQGKGDYLLAEEYYQKCLAISERSGSMLLVAMCSNNLGEIYRAQGKLDDALAGYERAMRINKEMDRLKGYVWNLGNCGMIQYARGNLDEALRLLEEALTIAKERRKTGLLTSYIGWGILFLVQVLVDKGMIEEARQQVEEFPQISRETLPRPEQIHRLCMAITLKASTAARDRTLAKEKLMSVVDGEQRDFEIISLAHLLLCELLVEDLRISGENDLLDELKERFTSFVDKTIEQGSTTLQTEAMILQSRIALLELDTREADRLLTQAQVIATQKGLERLAERVVFEHEMLLSELSISDELGREKPPPSERTSKARINEQIGHMIRQGIWRKMLF